MAEYFVAVLLLTAVVALILAMQANRRCDALARRLRELEPTANPYSNSVAQLRAAFPGAGIGQARGGGE